jgi:hypothetical protein
MKISTATKELTMRQQNLPFYPLESPDEPTFWPEAQRRVLILPVRDFTQFLALGVLGDKETAVFAARGKILEHLGDFLARMKEEGTRVELLREPPAHLTKLWREYARDEGYESKNAEPPPPPPPGLQSKNSAAHGLSS